MRPEMRIMMSMSTMIYVVLAHRKSRKMKMRKIVAGEVESDGLHIG